jgi:hypothetical protein
MANDPYTPPKAAVRDLGPDRAIAERPKQVTYAVWMLWLTFLVGLPAIVYEYQRATPEQLSVFLLLIFAVMSVVSIVLIVFTYRGHNWARILMLVLISLALISFFALFGAYLQYPLLPLASNIAVMVLDVLALYLLFTRPGRLWFRKSR